MAGVVHGKEECPYCVKAKELLDSRGVRYVYFDVMYDSISRAVLMGNGFKTVPQIYKHIGGYDELEKIL